MTCLLQFLEFPCQLVRNNRMRYYCCLRSAWFAVMMNFDLWAHVGGAWKCFCWQAELCFWLWRASCASLNQPYSSTAAIPITGPSWLAVTNLSLSSLSLSLSLLLSLTHITAKYLQVCASRYWFNYRHVANTLSIYRSVKRLGIPDRFVAPYIQYMYIHICINWKYMQTWIQRICKFCMYVHVSI